mmetsp:Transcript_28322/g.68013  ORF Transcript_28322/g.68013 Transcript_28322/m.68013 type:complete len:213 (-) Transcript_28322:720-1358(-)
MTSCLPNCLGPHACFHLAVLLGAALKNLPETEGFIGPSRQKRLFIWCERHAEHPPLVAGQRRDPLEAGVLPHVQLMVHVPVSRDDLPVMRVPYQAANLGPTVNGIDAGARGDVPEVDLSISCTSAGRQQPVVPGAPGDGLHGSPMLPERPPRDLGPLVPDVHDVVVAPRRELPPVGPLQSADFAVVGDQLADQMFPNPDVVQTDLAGPAPAR